MIKCYSCEDFDIDLMSCKDQYKRSLVVMADSKVRKNHKSPISTYSFIRGSYDSVLKRSVNDILKDLDVKLTIDQNEEITNSTTLELQLLEMVIAVSCVCV